MSAKQVRKLQAPKVSKNDDEDAKASSDGSEPAKESTKACGFAALIGSSETDSEAGEAEAVERADQAQRLRPVATATVSTGAAISKKKKKAKKSQAKKTDSSEGEELLLEAALAQAEVAANTAANSLRLEDDVILGNSLAMAKPFFNADRERRKLFKLKPHLTREQNSRKGQGLKVRGTNEGHFLHYRRLFLVEPTPDEGWPRPDGCAKMASDSSQYFRIETTPEHSKILLEFASYTMAFEPQMVHDFLMDHPFCVEALLVASEISRQGRDHQEAFQILRRAVYAAECSFNCAFSPFLETQVPMVRGDGCCFVSWPNVRVQLLSDDSAWPGWSWLMALWGYMLGLASQGLPRTALEVCKLILAMTLPHDPSHALVHLDYFALRAEEYYFFVQFAEEFNPPSALPNRSILRLDCCLPNFAYSAALAYYLRASTASGMGDDASALSTVNVEHLTEPYWIRPKRPNGSDGPSPAHLALMRAMLLFPRTLRAILDNLGVSLNSSISGSPCKLLWSELLDKSPFTGDKQTHQQHFLAHALISDAFAQRCAAFFRGERMLRWLHACAGRLVQMCESSLFEKELLAARRAWSEAPLVVSLALANDYKGFSTSEVGSERKAPAVFERAVNSWLGEMPERPQRAKAPPPLRAPPPPAVAKFPPPKAKALPAGYAIGQPLPPLPQHLPPPPPAVPPKAVPQRRLEETEDEEAQLQRALIAAQAETAAEERRRLVAEQDAEYRESLAADAARMGQAPSALDSEDLAHLEAMGFDSSAAADALRAAGNVEGAVELLMSQ